MLTPLIGTWWRTEEVFRFRFRRIRRVNTDSGNCSIAMNDDEWNMYNVVFGEIHDPRLRLPNNEYTRAMNLHLGGVVFAQADIVAGFVRRLYIKDIRVDG